MEFAAKVLYNDQDWVRPSGLAETDLGINVQFNKLDYNFGMEEWLNHSMLKKSKIGYLDCYRASQYSGKAKIIRLFTYKRINKVPTIIHIGNLYEVVQVQCDEIESLVSEFTIKNWLALEDNNFSAIKDFRTLQNHIEYQSVWNKKQIVADRGEGFVFNVRYEEMVLFKESEKRNLTKKMSEINNKWRRLSKRYEVTNDLKSLFY